MAISNLLERIQGDTARDAEAIRAEAEHAAQAIEAAAKAQEESLLRLEVDHLRTEAEFAERKRLSARENELRRAFLNEREALLREVLNDLEEWLSSLPASEEKKLLAATLALGQKDIPSGTIRLSARTRELLGLVGGFTAEVDDSIPAGFVLRSADGKRMLDLTFTALVDDFWKNRRIDIARQLFGSSMRLAGSAS